METFKYKYNELVYAEDILSGGFKSQYYNTEMLILAKYWKHKGFKPAERKIKMYEFCTNHIQGFSRELFYKNINSVLNKAKKKEVKLIIIDSLPITKAEFKFINDIEMEDIYKKILFSYMVKNKLSKMICEILYGKSSDYNYYGGSHKAFSEIKDMSGMKRSDNIYHLNGDLEESGLIEIKNKGKISLNFIGEINTSDDSIAFNIKNFDLIYGYFEHFNGNKNYLICEKCGDLTRKKGKNQKYCSLCSTLKEKENTKLRVERHREL